MIFINQEQNLRSLPFPLFTIPLFSIFALFLLYIPIS